MRRIIAQVAQLSVAMMVLGQTPALAADSVSLLPATKPPLVSILSVVQPRSLFQHRTYPAAWTAAQKSNRPILVFVSMPNCHYCEKMKSQVLRLPRVKNLVSDSFETVQAGRYSHAKLVQNLHVKWYPTTVLVGQNNKILDVIEGYTDANQFQQRLQTGLASAHGVSGATQTR